MMRTITTVLLTVLAVLFTINNFDHVPVHLIFGREIQIRLIFVIAVSALVGFMFRHFIGVSREEELKRRLLQERRKNKSRGKLIDVSEYVD